MSEIMKIELSQEAWAHLFYNLADYIVYMQEEVQRLRKQKFRYAEEIAKGHQDTIEWLVKTRKEMLDQLKKQGYSKYLWSTEHVS